MPHILILGGYGAVGREAAAALLDVVPGATVTVAGRNPDAARPVPHATARRVDVSSDTEVAAALDGTDVVLMCAERDNARVARACLERGIHYVDVSATRAVLEPIAALDTLARDHGATALLSVGLVPGVTNLLAAYAVGGGGARTVRVGVLLGVGDRHGPAALRWTLEGLGELEGSWDMAFPTPYGVRRVHRFPFSDQYTLPGTLGLDDAVTGLCLDSRVVTALLAAARWPGAAGLLRRPWLREALVAVLGRARLGGDGFAVVVEAGGARVSLRGWRQSWATGLTAALLVRRLAALPAGVHHVEQVVDPVEVLGELAARGFELDLDEVG